MFTTEKITNKTQYIIRNEKLNCKELWYFVADYLGFGDSDNPAMALITHLSESYSSIEIRREFYCDDKSHRYTSTAGFLFVFHRLAEAKKFCEELNSKVA